MYTHERAAEALVAMKKEIDIGNLFRTDAYGLAESFADTIRQHEDSMVNLSSKFLDLDDEVLDQSLVIEIQKQEIRNLKEERDQLLDDNVSLADENASLRHVVGAIESVLEISR